MVTGRRGALRRCLASVSLGGWLGTAAAGARPLVLGTIEESQPIIRIRKLLPVARYLARQLQGEGIDEGKVLIAQSIPQMAEYLRTGKVDLLIDSSYPAAVLANVAGAPFLARRWKKGKSDYRSFIFSSRSSGVRSVPELKGKIVAFEERYSTSGYHLPRQVLEQAGLKLRELSHLGQPFPAGEVGFVFSEDDETTMVWVLSGRVAAGAMDQQNFLGHAKGELPNLAVLHKSVVFPRQLVSHRAGLAPALVVKIKQALLAMDRSPEGRMVLAAFDHTAKFDEIPPESFALLQQLRRQVRVTAAGSGK